MFKKEEEGLFLVHYNGYYMSSPDYRTQDCLRLDSDIKEATVFDNLKRATLWAKRLRGEVLFYNHDYTEIHNYSDLSFKKVHR